MHHQSTSVFDRPFCEKYGLLPEQTGGSVVLWLSDKTDLSILNFVFSVMGEKPTLKRTSTQEFSEKLENCFKNGSPSNGRECADSESAAVEGKVVEGINSLLKSCISDRASDIHFEPQESTMVCRARIDGVLIRKKIIERSEVAETVSRLKIMAGLDIAEKRRPQDGRIRFRYQDRMIDIRVSVIPTDFGEKVVLRILDKKSLRLSLDSLGFTDKQQRLFKEGIQSPHGIILVTGPTGSGKTTTLYAALSHLKSPGINISTVEDPIEYNLEGINQTQVKPEIGLTFSAMLRALLRQDPNILMVGEVRDRETLDIAIRAALTGHLVLSTVHTNNAVATLTRLRDMGADNSLMATTLRLVVAQRLVRRNCTDCIDVSIDENNRAAAEKLKIDLTATARQSRGCEQCNHTGFRGRVAVYEVLSINNDIKDAISNGKLESEVLKIAGNLGFSSMLQVAQSFINSGVTTPAEVLREINA